MNGASSQLLGQPQDSGRRAFSTSSKKETTEQQAPPEDTAPSSNNNSTNNNTALPISFADISRAEVSIRGGVKRTPCDYSPFLSEVVGADVYLKHEFRQFTGSFKERGARNAILQLLQQTKSSVKGVIAASAGNHAQALAYHGQQLGVAATVVMPTTAPIAKVDKCRVRIYVRFHHLSLFAIRY